MADSKECEVKVVNVYEDAKGHAYVLLRDDIGRSLPIWIGPCEALAISIALRDNKVQRPMTHDLMKNILDRLNAQVDSIIIDDLWNLTYYARINLNVNGEIINMDARPSDAIALALRTQSPIFVKENVIRQWLKEEGESP